MPARLILTSPAPNQAWILGHPQAITWTGGDPSWPVSISLIDPLVDEPPTAATSATPTASTTALATASTSTTLSDPSSAFTVMETSNSNLISSLTHTPLKGHERKFVWTPQKQGSFVVSIQVNPDNSSAPQDCITSSLFHCIPVPLPGLFHWNLLYQVASQRPRIASNLQDFVQDLMFNLAENQNVKTKTRLRRLRLFYRMITEAKLWEILQLQMRQILVWQASEEFSSCSLSFLFPEHIFAKSIGVFDNALVNPKQQSVCKALTKSVFERNDGLLDLAMNDIMFTIRKRFLYDRILQPMLISGRILLLAKRGFGVGFIAQSFAREHKLRAHIMQEITDVFSKGGDQECGVWIDPSLSRERFLVLRGQVMQVCMSVLKEKQLEFAVNSKIDSSSEQKSAGGKGVNFRGGPFGSMIVHDFLPVCSSITSVTLPTLVSFSRDKEKEEKTEEIAVKLAFDAENLWIEGYRSVNEPIEKRAGASDKSQSVLEPNIIKREKPLEPTPVIVSSNRSLTYSQTKGLVRHFQNLHLKMAFRLADSSYISSVTDSSSTFASFTLAYAKLFDLYIPYQDDCNLALSFQRLRRATEQISELENAAIQENAFHSDLGHKREVEYVGLFGGVTSRVITAMPISLRGTSAFFSFSTRIQPLSFDNQYGHILAMYLPNGDSKVVLHYCGQVYGANAGSVGFYVVPKHRGRETTDPVLFCPLPLRQWSDLSASFDLESGRLSLEVNQQVRTCKFPQHNFDSDWSRYEVCVGGGRRTNKEDYFHGFLRDWALHSSNGSAQWSFSDSGVVSSPASPALSCAVTFPKLDSL